MPTLVLKRIWGAGLSLQNALKAPYEGFINGKRIGVIYYNPITKELLPESKDLLEKTGCVNFEIEVIKN